MGIYSERSHLLLMICLSMGKMAYGQPEMFGRLVQNPTGSIENKVSLRGESSVKQIGFGSEEAPEMANGSKTHAEKTRRIAWSKKADGTQVEYTLQRLIWGEGDDKPDYDSDNTFERSDMGDQMGKKLDPFYGKSAKILYRSNNMVDTLNSPKKFFTIWQGYKAVSLSDRYTVWDDILLVSALNQPLATGFQWSDSIRVESYLFVDSYTVLQTDDQTATLVLKRNGTPLAQALPADGTMPTVPGNYLGPARATGKLTIDRQTGLILNMEVRKESRRVDVRKNITIDVTSTQNATVTNTRK